MGRRSCHVVGTANEKGALDFFDEGWVTVRLMQSSECIGRLTELPCICASLETDNFGQIRIVEEGGCEELLNSRSGDLLF